jgi:hypothetical protein
VNRAKGKCAGSGEARFGRSTADRPAANANRSGPTSSRAPLAPAWIPKGLLANSFLTEVLVLKFLYHLPLERIRARARRAG